MFNQQNNEEKKLDWMYKGPNSMVNREDYLLGRTVDNTLEQLNEEEKLKQQGLLVTPKNRVEHECIPPSIRDFNKVVATEQVDLSAKLQEDPLVEIKKREEESRRQFLQNPVQLKKLQKALKAQQAKRNKKKKKKSKKSDSDSDLDLKLAEKLLGKNSKRYSKEERDLDIILIHKYEEFKDKLTEDDLREILNGDYSSDSSEDTESRRDKKRKPKKNHTKRQTSSESSSDSEEDSDHSSRKKRNYGLVSAAGKKIALNHKDSRRKSEEKARSSAKAPDPPYYVPKHRAKKMSEEEKEKLRREMMNNAIERDKERADKVRKYREKDEKERKEQSYDPDFIHKQLVKTAHNTTVESRIKANLNNIQRSSRDMDKNFSRRH